MADIFADTCQAPVNADTAAVPFWHTLTTPAVRDLAWLLLSPALLADADGAVTTGLPDGVLLANPLDPLIFGAAAQERLQQWLCALDSAPASLLAAVAAGTMPRRLGRYAERLLQFWLQQTPSIALQACSLPVREGGRTLGECDALFRTQTPEGSHDEHWELAVKFYLCIAPHAIPSAPVCPASAAADWPDCARFVGAGLADRFDWKLTRLSQHQLPLSAHPALQRLAPGHWTPRMFVKGRLFYPLANWQDRRRDPAVLAPAHLRGWWASEDSWRAWMRTSACVWMPLDRLDWLATQSPDAGQISSAADFDAVVSRHFATDPAPGALQVAALLPRSDAQGWQELSRGFIVPNDWPERAQRFYSGAATYHH